MVAREERDLVGDRTQMVTIGAGAVFVACAVFGVVRLFAELTSGLRTPWWANVGGAILIAALYVWFRRAPEKRSVVAAHGIAAVATLALLVPAAYGMPSSKWWLALVGFAMLLMGRNREAAVWAVITTLLVPTTALFEGLWQVPNAIGEPVAERALASLFFVLILFGITFAFRREARRRARELRETAVSLERANRVRARFLAHMSHEIRTPLHGVIAMTDLALAEDGADVREQVQTAHESAQVLLTLLNNILDVTRADADAIELVDAPFALHDTLGEMLAPLAARARAEGLRFEARAEPGVLEQRVGDRVRFAQMVLNLVSNAIKFTDEGGVEVLLRAEGERVEVVVTDSGRGIAEEDAERVFTPFVQATSDDERFAGAGLGLAITRSLARLMDGDAWVRPHEGGAKVGFHVRLPPADGAKPGTEDLLAGRTSRPSVVEPPAVSLRILVCEDEAVNRRALSRMLRRMGHEVLLAEDGERALEVLAAERVDLLITDIEMPVMRGDELIRRCRAGEASQELAILAATAHVGVAEEHRLLALGADAHLPKPFTLEMLATVIGQLAGGRPSEELGCASGE